MSEEVVNISNTTYGNGVGSFGIINGSSVSYYACRDQFLTYSEASESFVFVCKNGKMDNVINFMKRVEQIINLPNESALTFKPTNRKNVLFVKMGVFWKYRVRRSLLSALLRCGQNFDEDTGKGFVKALHSTSYTKNTKVALDRFLSGATAVKIKKDTFSGWQNAFASRTAEQVKSMLVKLKKKKEQKPEIIKGDII